MTTDKSKLNPDNVRVVTAADKFSPELLDSVIINHGEQILYLNGKPFPYFMSEAPTVHPTELGDDPVYILTLKVYASDVLETTSVL